jgi:hypothetical protein
VESGKQSTLGLPGCTEIFQIFMVGPDQEWLFCSFQPVPPLFQRYLDRQEVSVAYVVVPLSRIETILVLG